MRKITIFHVVLLYSNHSQYFYIFNIRTIVKVCTIIVCLDWIDQSGTVVEGKSMLLVAEKNNSTTAI